MENQNQPNDSHSSECFQDFEFDMVDSITSATHDSSSEYENIFDSTQNTGNTTASFRRTLRNNSNSTIHGNTSRDDVDHSYSDRNVIEDFHDSNISHELINNINRSLSLNRSSQIINNMEGNESTTLNSVIEADFGYENNIEDYLDDSDDEFYDGLQDISFDENDYRPTYTKLFELLQDDFANETITANIVVSKIEILLAILKFAFVYSIPNTAIADLCKMFNSFLDVRLLPDTRYLIDKLFYPDEGIQYHAVCPNCQNYVKEFTKQNVRIRCDICEQNINLKDPSYRDFFVILNIENELQHLIENNQDYYINIVNRAQEAEASNFEDIHDGQKYKDFVSSLPEDRKKSYLSVTFNSDGSPIFKSSKCSIWPIQIIPNEIPASMRNKRPLTYALWFGRNKPEMNTFLAPFVKGINRLSSTGLNCTINNEAKNIKVYALCCCVDSVARAPMQGLIQFNGYYGCNWCLHPGMLVPHKTGTAMKYTLLNYVPQRRSERETLHHMQEAVNVGVSVYGVKKATPLIELNNFNIIDGFVPDPMHCIDLGIVKQFADYWFNSTNNKLYSISNADIKRIDKYIKSFKVPTQLARLSRSIMDRKFWKAREWENWLLYYSLPTLQEIGFQQYLEHWALLVEAFYILQQSSITINELLMTDRLLKKFVAETELYYGADAMTFNVHQLIHIPQSVADWGPLWAHSGYAFESGNGQIIRTVHAAKGVLSQICRNLSIKESIIMMERHVFQREQSPVKEYCFYLQNRCTAKSLKLGINRYFGKARKPENGFIVNMNVPGTDRYKGYAKMIKNQCVSKSCKKVLHRSCNSFAQTVDGEYIQIIQFIVDNIDNMEYTLYKKLEVENSFNGVCTSIQRVIRIQDDFNIIETSEINKLCVYMEVKKNIIFQLYQTCTGIHKVYRYLNQMSIIHTAELIVYSLISTQLICI